MIGSARPIGIDLFSGAGGLSLGFEQAGFDVVAAVEIDPVHAAIHKFNFPDCAILPRSVIGLSGQEFRSAARIGVEYGRRGVRRRTVSRVLADGPACS